MPRVTLQARIVDSGHARMLRNPKFISGDFDTNFIDTQFQPQDEARVKPNEDIALIAAAIKAYRRDKARALAMLGGGPGGDEHSQWKSSGRVRRESAL